jgi:hypothetical protein
MYNAVVADCAAIAGPSLLCVEKGGVTVAAAGKPVSEVPGDTPTSPLTTVPVPAAVTELPPSTAKLVAEPVEGGV